MKDEDKTKEQLLNELAELRQRIAELRVETERTRTEEALGRYAKQLEALHRVGLELTTELDLDTLLHSIVSRATELVGETSGGLYLYRPEQDILEWTVAVGPNLAPTGSVLHRGEGLSGKVWETGKPLIVDDYQHWEGRAAAYESYPFTAIVGVPVRWGEEFLGVLDVLTDRPRTFSQADAELLSMFATQAAIAIRNAQLYDAAQRELTERKRVEEELRKLKEFNESIIQSMAEGIVVEDTEGYITFVNPATVTLLGYTPEELLGQHWTIVIPPDQRPIVQGANDLRLQGQSSQYEVEMLRKDGTRLSVLVSGSPRFEGGHFVGTMAVFIDITDRKRAEERLRLLSSAVEQSTEGIAVSDLEGNLLFVNNAFAALHGYTSEELIGKHLSVFHTPEQMPSVEASSRQVQETGEFSGELWHARRDGTVFPSLMRNSILRDEVDNPVGMIGTMRDITERKQAEEALRRAHDELEIRVQERTAELTVANEALQAEIAERKQTEEMLERRAAQLALINDIGKKIAAALDLDALLTSVAHLVQENFGYYHVGLFLLDEAVGELRMKALAGGFADIAPPDHRLALGVGLVGYTAETGQPLLVNDVSQEPRYVLGILKESLTKSELCVPLKLADKVIGVLDIQSTQLNAFNGMDLMTVETLADQLAGAIENARLYQEVMRRLEEAKAFSAVTVTLARSLELDQVLQSIVDSAIRLIPASTSSVIHLVDEAAGKLIPWATSAPEANIQEKLEMSIGEGIAGLVVREKRLINVPNVEEDPRFLLAASLAHMKSLLTVPLIIDGNCIGTLSLNGQRVGAFSADDERLLTTLAAQAAVAVRNARLHQQIQRQLEELTFLSRVGRTVISSLDLEQVLTTVMEETALMLMTEACSVLLLDEESSELVFEAAVGPYSEGMKGLRLPLGRGVAGWVAREGQRLLVPDVGEDPRFYSGIDEATGFVTRSIFAVPLKVKGRVIGVIEAVNKVEGNFSQEDVGLLSSMAQWAAIAIENARLYTEIKQRVEELSLLNRVATTAISTLDSQAVLQVVVDEIPRAFGLEQCAVVLLSEDCRKASVMAEYSLPDRPSTLGMAFPVADDLVMSHVLKTRLPLFIADAQHDPLLAPFHDLLCRRGTLSLLTVPLVTHGQVVGSIMLEATGQIRHFRSEEIALAQTLAGQVALALEKARLYEVVSQAKREWEVTFDAIADGISILNADFRITRANRTLAAWLGTTPEALIGRICYELIHHGDTPIKACPHLQAMQSGQPQSMEIEVSGLEGTFLVSAYPLLHVEKEEGIASVHVLRDITEQKRLQTSLIQAEKLSALGRLAASLAHEINNPLQSVAGCLDLAQEELAEGEDVGEYLQIAREEVQRVSRTVTQMRDLSRPPSEERKSVGVNALLEQVLELSKKQCQKNQIEVAWRAAADLPPLLLVTDQIKQVFLNLLLNAIESMPEGGRLQVSTAYTSQPAGVRIEFTDSGEGIAPDVLTQIFEPFYSTKPGGTGLGLSISYSIVEQHGGHIEVESQVGEGSTFTVWLPA